MADSPSVLIVDDDVEMLQVLSRSLRSRGYECRLAGGAEAARESLRREPADLLLCDVRMPGESGLDLVREVIAQYPETAVLMMSGEDDPGVAKIAFEGGACGYVVKPFTPNEVAINVMNALRLRRLEAENQAFIGMLERKLRDRTAGLDRALEQIAGADATWGEETISRLSDLLRFRDEETGRHTERIGLYSNVVARALDLTEAGRIRLGALMHDIGKVAIPDHILLKPGLLTHSERAVVQTHAEVGHRILSGWRGEMLAVAATIAHTHHERFDGTGYPRGLAGEAVPIEGRIVGLVDAFDALTTRRPYRDAVSTAEAVAILETDRGSHFDPRVFDQFVLVIEEIEDVRRDYADVA